MAYQVQKQAQHNFIFTPAESASLFIEYAEYIKNTPGISFGVKTVDKHVIPARPGEVVAFVARPGGGKSSVMSALAKRTAENIAKNGTASLNRDEPGEAVLYASWEQMIETQEAFTEAGDKFSVSDIAWGRADIDDLKREAVKRPNLPLWIAGRSFADAGKRVPPMYVDTLFDNINDMAYHYNVKFRLICLDYLQNIPTNKKSKASRTEQVSQAIADAKDLAMAVGCPVFIGVQAKDTVDKSANKIPTMGDTYYTSELDHVIDKGFGLFRPSRILPPGDIVDFSWGKETYQLPVTDNLLLMQLFKQRGEQGNRKFALYFDPAKLILADLPEMKNINLNDY